MRPGSVECLGQGCARAGDVDPLEAASAVPENLAAVKPQLRLVDDQVFQFIDRKPRPGNQAIQGTFLPGRSSSRPEAAPPHTVL